MAHAVCLSSCAAKGEEEAPERRNDLRRRCLCIARLEINVKVEHEEAKGLGDRHERREQGGHRLVDLAPQEGDVVGQPRLVAFGRCTVSKDVRSASRCFLHIGKELCCTVKAHRGPSRVCIVLQGAPQIDTVLRDELIAAVAIRGDDCVFDR